MPCAVKKRPACGGQPHTRRQLYRESWAVVIGINDYAQLAQARYAVARRGGREELLVERYGFLPDHVTLLKDGEATRARILSALERA